MKQSFIYILVGMILLMGQTSLAQLSCSEALKEPAVDPTEFQYERQMLTELQAIKQELNQAKLLSVANGNIHNLVVMGNRVLDRAVDYIIEVNFMKLSPFVKAKKSHMAEQLIEQLQLTFEVGNNAMTAAIKNRVNFEVSEIKVKMEAQETRRAIGFGRDQSAESFHGEEVQKQPIGFRTPPKESPVDIEPVEKQPIGFGTKGAKELNDSVKKLVEYEEPGVASEKVPMGFIPLKGESKDPSAEKEPIGFIHFRPQSEKISESGLHKILFDIDSGIFEFQRGEP